MKMHIASVMLGLGLLFGCTDAPEQIDARVTVVPADAQIEVTPDQLTFLRAGNDLLAARRPGDILVSATGEGFLRSVVDVHDDGDRIVLDTAPAELGDAIVSGDVASSLTLRGDNGKADTHSLDLIQVLIGDETLLDTEALTVIAHHAALSARPSLDLDLKVRDRRVEYFEAILRGNVNAALDLEVRAAPGTLSQSLTLWQSPPLVFYQQLGPVPVVETVSISVGVDLQITARSETRARLLGGLVSGVSAGMRYRNGKWSRVSEQHHDLDGEILLDGDMEVRATLFARADLKFYGVIGPYIKLGPYVQLNHPLGTRQVQGRVGLHGAVGGELSLLGVTIAALPQYTLFDVSQPAF